MSGNSSTTNTERYMYVESHACHAQPNLNPNLNLRSCIQSDPEFAFSFRPFPAETMHWAITYNQWKGYIKDTQVVGKRWRKHISKCYSVLAVGLTGTLPTYPGNLEAYQSDRQHEQTDRTSHKEQFEVLLDCKINPKLSYEGYRRWQWNNKQFCFLYLFR